VVEAIQGAANSGKIGDGKIFVYELERVMRIRTGELDGRRALKLARFRPHLLFAIALALDAGSAGAAAIHQPLAYHHFADARTLLGVAEFLERRFEPALRAGRHRRPALDAARTSHPLRANCAPAWLVLFVGVALVGLGSGWYHLGPGNARWSGIGCR
jgi:hypothetical protein